MDRLIQQLKNAYRRHRFVAAYAVFALIVLAALVLLTIPGKHNVVLAPSELPADSIESATKDDRYLLKPSEPMRLVIPKINLDVPFEAPLSLNADKTVGIPKAYDTVGWYDGSPTPGELGPSIVLGHVDSYQGAAVFYHLGQLEPGDEFQIGRADGSKPIFVVEKLERYPQSDFPTDLVYGPIGYAGIRLITCSGTYDHGSLRYSHNLVVYGRLVDPRDQTASTSQSGE